MMNKTMAPVCLRLKRIRKSKSWLATFKSIIFCPPTPNNELRNGLQRKGEAMRAGGLEEGPIKIVETAGKILESNLVQVVPLNLVFRF